MKVVSIMHMIKHELHHQVSHGTTGPTNIFHYSSPKAPHVLPSKITKEPKGLETKDLCDVDGTTWDLQHQLKQHLDAFLTQNGPPEISRRNVSMDRWYTQIPGTHRCLSRLDPEILPALTKTDGFLYKALNKKKRSPLSPLMCQSICRGCNALYLLTLKI